MLIRLNKKTNKNGLISIEVNAQYNEIENNKSYNKNRSNIFI